MNILTNRGGAWRWLGLILVVIALDQWSKDFIARHFTESLPQQKIVQTVRFLAAKDGHAVAPVVEAQFPCQSKAAGVNVEGQAHAIGVVGKALHRPDEAHKETTAVGVGVLIEVEDVAAVAEHEVRKAGDDAFAVGAVDEKDGVHGAIVAASGPGGKGGSLLPSHLSPFNIH